MKATVIRGDARALPLADNSVDLVVSSPPYFALRSYQDRELCKRCLVMLDWDPKRNLRESWPDWDAHVAAEHKPMHYPGQIGSEATPAEFVDALIEVTRECVRVLKPSGSIWINLGDKYAAGHGGSSTEGNGVNINVGHPAKANFRERPDLPNPPASWGKRDASGRAIVPGLRPKSLMGVPWRYALRCIDDLGLILRAEVIWAKPNGLPESVTDRVRRSHEQWFHFVTQPRYYSAVDEIREGYAPATAKRYAAGYNPRAVDSARPSVNTKLGGDTYNENPLGKLPGSVWSIATEPLKVPDHLGVDHFAAFPLEWPRRIIQGWSPPGVCTACGEGRRPVVDKLLRDVSISTRTKLAKQGGRSRSNHGMATVGVPMPMGSTEATITGYACACPEPTAPTKPAIVADIFGGTGTTALAARALGRHGISVDMSQDYSRLARWRTTDEGELAKAMRVDKPAIQVDGQGSLLELIEEVS